MDPDTGLCRGCYRTMDEIARWTSLTDRQRETVLRHINERRRATTPCEK